MFFSKPACEISPMFGKKKETKDKLRFLEERKWYVNWNCEREWHPYLSSVTTTEFPLFELVNVTIDFCPKKW